MPAVPINGARTSLVSPCSMCRPTRLGRLMPTWRAGIPKDAIGGKLDFHAVRLAYINLIIEAGATVKEAQTLARHATPR